VGIGDAALRWWWWWWEAWRCVWCCSPCRWWKAPFGDAGGARPDNGGGGDGGDDGDGDGGDNGDNGDDGRDGDDGGCAESDRTVVGAPAPSPDPSCGGNCTSSGSCRAKARSE
jgi:hypothetical protein